MRVCLLEIQTKAFMDEIICSLQLQSKQSSEVWRNEESIDNIRLVTCRQLFVCFVRIFFFLWLGASVGDRI